MTHEHSPIAQYAIHMPLIMNKHVPIESIFGVRMQQVTDDFGLPEAVAAGAKTVRSVTFSWSLIEPVRTSPPTYVWTAVDTASLENAANSGLELIGNIHHTPSWAQALPGYSCGPIKADRLSAFAQFLQALVSRYSVHPYHVRHWSIWNEPDIDPLDAHLPPDSRIGCWGDADLPDFGGSAFGQMLQVAYPAIKAAAPEAEVIVGGLLLDKPSGVPSEFTRGILQGGGGPYFDVLGFNVYTYYQGALGVMRNGNWDSITAIPEKAAFLRSVLDDYGFEDKPIMATEGSMLVISDNPTPDSLETQAMYVPRAYAEALSLGLTKLIYYSMTDDWEGRNNGLLRGDLSKKPSYYAYEAATSFFSQAYYTSLVSGYPVGVEGYAFGLISGNRMDVIWSIDGQPRMVAVPVGALAYDRYGVSLGSGTIQLGYSPVYVVKP